MADDTAQSVRPPFPVVGIGASAGGLDAYKRFLESMPSDSGMAFVLIPHLDPKHESLMVELLAKHTSMAICQVEEAMSLQPNHIYVIPPNRFLSIGEGVLRLEEPPDPVGRKTAIDHFFRSLAAAYGEMAIGIVLSGTGAHGTVGIREISGLGGLVLAQDPETAGYEQMPQNAIDTGLVDYILPVEKMPEVLIGYREQLKIRTQEGTKPVTEETAQLERILNLMLSRTRYDFRCYRKKMLMRRIRRRMDLGHFEHLKTYYELLKDDPDEISLLFRDLLINVTSFFRDAAAFDQLQAQVIEPLVKEKTADVPVRVWVPACATGEEAYSVAILLMEAFSRQQQLYDIQIFATDLDEDVLEHARQGV